MAFTLRKDSFRTLIHGLSECKRARSAMRRIQVKETDEDRSRLISKRQEMRKPDAKIPVDWLFITNRPECQVLYSSLYRRFILSPPYVQSFTCKASVCPSPAGRKLRCWFRSGCCRQLLLPDASCRQPSWHI